MGARSLTHLTEELERRFAAGVEKPWPADEFNALAMDAFAIQFEAIPAYRGFCEGRKRTPSTVSSWHEVPAIPADAFKHLDLSVGEPEVVFRTSGTTRGGDRRGRHLVPSASLYRASLLPPFEAHVLDQSPVRIVSLIPSPEHSPDSSLSFMVGAAAAAFASQAHWFVDAGGALDEDGLRTQLGRSSSTDEPVLILGTAIAILHAVERFETTPIEPLPDGSWIMETGGFKGFDREISRADFYESVTSATGVPRGRIVSEYGMTELLSQLYEPVLSEGLGAAGVFVPPPWLRVRALDPVTLGEVGPGDPGLLAFFDLANVGSVCHVLTEDVGAVVDGRVHLQGRIEGAEPRGCSRAMDELMASHRPSS
ncbi:MAG: hypothetical protein OEO79_10105 [Gemmatimonadota bacterium]|nr:hypothetical protein [Gemmatimonadota bacterium]